MRYALQQFAFFLQRAEHEIRAFGGNQYGVALVKPVVPGDAVLIGHLERNLALDAGIYNEAVKSGNPRSIVTFNPGVKKDLIRHCRAADYTAGEIADELLTTTPPGRWVEGAQAHVLTYLGESWGSYNTARFTDEQIKEWTRTFTQNGGVVMFDVGPNYDASVGPIGSIGKVQLRQLAAAVKAAGL